MPMLTSDRTSWLRGNAHALWIRWSTLMPMLTSDEPQQLHANAHAHTEARARTGPWLFVNAHARVRLVHANAHARVRRDAAVAR